jgi:hypothetical protein
MPKRKSFNNYKGEDLKMFKKIVLSAILILSIIALSGCNQAITYSDKFEGIPIYPTIKLIASTEYEESYEVLEFSDTFEEVKAFYMENIDQEKWKIEKNTLSPIVEYPGFKSQGYMLKSEKQEISLIIGLQTTENKGDILRIDLNGNLFKEGKYIVEGKSENWETSLEYIIRKDGIFINGDVIYTGDNPPKKVDNKFLIYEIKAESSPEENLTVESLSQETQGRQLEDSKFNISSQSNRKYELEVYEDAIKHGYIEIKWEEQDENKTEKINFK